MCLWLGGSGAPQLGALVPLTSPEPKSWTALGLGRGDVGAGSHDKAVTEGQCQLMTSTPILFLD